MGLALPVAVHNMPRVILTRIPQPYIQALRWPGRSPLERKTILKLSSERKAQSARLSAQGSERSAQSAKSSMGWHRISLRHC